MVEEKLHIPVMLHEVIDYLNPRPGQIIVDATLGTGGHSQEILKRITPGGRLIGIDRDEDSLAVCRKRFSEFAGSYELVQANFVDLDQVLGEQEMTSIRNTESQIGSANLPSLTTTTGASPTGNINGTIVDQKTKDIFARASALASLGNPFA